MHSKSRIVLAVVLMILAVASAQAQVERAAARANRPLWGSCGATIKAALERQDGVAEVIIDQQSNIVFVTYKPETHFDPAILRDAADQADAAFLVIQVLARGRIAEENGKHFLVAGEDRFLLLEPTDPSKPLPPVSDELLSVVANVDDTGNPVKLKVVQAKPAEPTEP